MSIEKKILNYDNDSKKSLWNISYKTFIFTIFTYLFFILIGEIIGAQSEGTMVLAIFPTIGLSIIFNSILYRFSGIKIKAYIYDKRNINKNLSEIILSYKINDKNYDKILKMKNEEIGNDEYIEIIVDKNNTSSFRLKNINKSLFIMGIIVFSVSTAWPSYIIYEFSKYC